MATARCSSSRATRTAASPPRSPPTRPSRAAASTERDGVRRGRASPLQRVLGEQLRAPENRRDEPDRVGDRRHQLRDSWPSSSRPRRAPTWRGPGPHARALRARHASRARRCPARRVGHDPRPSRGSYPRAVGTQSAHVRATATQALDALAAPFVHARLTRVRDHRPWPMPRRPWVMGQTWRDLLFAHWDVAPATLRQAVPAQLELDTFDGRAWIAVTPFVVRNLRVRLTLPLPVISAFPEINVPTYGTLKDRPGIYFFSLDADST